MRPVAHFTVHAILAAALAALATTSAAAQPEADRFRLELGGEGEAAKGDKPRVAVLEVEAFKWGNAADATTLGSWAKAEGLDVTWDVADQRGASKIDSFAVKQKIAEQPRYPSGTLSGSTGAGASGAASWDTATTDGNRTGSGLPTGKRQHKPFTLATPLGKGSVWIRVSSPWAGCRAGKRYPSLALSDGTTSYRLLGATVAGCGRSSAQPDRPAEEVAFYYNKIM